jgi:hypothetical protein
MAFFDLNKVKIDFVYLNACSAIKKKDIAMICNFMNFDFLRRQGDISPCTPIFPLIP